MFFLVVVVAIFGMLYRSTPIFYFLYVFSISTSFGINSKLRKIKRNNRRNYIFIFFLIFAIYVNSIFNIYSFLFLQSILTFFISLYYFFFSFWLLLFFLYLLSRTRTFIGEDKKNAIIVIFNCF